MNSNVTRSDIGTLRRTHGAPARSRLATVTPIPQRRPTTGDRWPLLVMTLIVSLFVAAFVKDVLLPAAEIVAVSTVDGWSPEGP